MSKSQRSVYGLILCVTFAAIGMAGLAADNTKTPALPNKVSPEDAAFFENHVRPLLANRCYACHSDKIQSGGIRLDSLQALLKGNSAGPALVPGHPDKSLLLQVLSYEGKIKMPPTGKLHSSEIATLTDWIKRGAPWPGAVVSADALKAGKTGIVTEAQRRFWSFRGVQRPVVPKVKNAAWVKTPVDAFILSKLEGKGLAPSPVVDKRSLLRRVTFDLTGLPPTPLEMASFLSDKSVGAYGKVVERLLASPRYGERWGRRWLDVARYADTKGYSFTEDSNYYNAYTYRDWVIRAFNEDLPYDRFLIQQLAADRLPLGDDKRPLAALGFLTLGRRFLNDPTLINDDRIDTVTRGMLGLTVSCARCHDHKFDPIPAADYYSLYGVFASSVEPNPPLPISPKNITEPYEAHNKQILEATKKRDDIIRAQVTRLRSIVEKTPNELPTKVKNTLQSIRVNTLPSEQEQGVLMGYFEPDTINQLRTLRQTLDDLRKTMPPTPEFASALVDAPTPMQPYIFLRGNPGNRGESVPRRFLAVLSEPERKPFAQGSGRLELAQAIASKNNPLTARVMVNRVWMYHFGEGLVRTPSDFGTRGEPPTHPELLDWLAATFVAPPSEGIQVFRYSGIQEKAVSKHLNTPGCGWSVKKLHRLILLSNTYQQSVGDNPRAYAKDPENRLLWRQNRERFDLETLRDSLLFVSGQLDTTLGGKAVDILKSPFTKRRTVYGYIERQNLPGLFRTFDFASPDTSSSKRYNTTVPQQALYMMNSPFVVEQAQSLANRPEVVGKKDATQRIRALYNLLYNRAPTQQEILLGLAFVQRPQTPVSRPAPLWSYGYGAFDEAAQRVVGFTPLPHFTGSEWQGGPERPDPKLKWLLLTATGGHVGADAQHAVIRRWTAPVDAVISIQGVLKHKDKRGDGVRGRIVSSRGGELGHWTVFNSQEDTNVGPVVVKRGDTIDFVVDCRAEHSFDVFSWAPILRTAPSSGAKTASQSPSQEWSASAGFRGPDEYKSLTNWEQYAQTLLMTNEFCFAD